jgi:CrcB protein
MTPLYLILGGASGTLARYYLSLWVANATGSAPVGTFAVNISGSFLIGVFLTLGTERFSWPAALVMLVAVGFLGGYTTFSTLSWQSLQQLEAGDLPRAAINLAASAGGGVLAAWLGMQVARVAV